MTRDAATQFYKRPDSIPVEVWRRARTDRAYRIQLARKSIAFFAAYYLRAGGKPVAIPHYHLKLYREVGTGDGYKRAPFRQRRRLILAPRDHGKCLALGTLVLMFDGRRVPVEQVREGDLLMGPDSKPRRVLGTTRGRGPLIRVVPAKGDPWTCNDEHILTVEERGTGDARQDGMRRRARTAWSAEKGRRVIKDISVKEWMASSKWFKSTHRQFSVGVDFAQQDPLPVDPYFLGVWLGDGDKDWQRVAITTADPEIVQLVEDTAKLYGLAVRPPTPTQRYRYRLVNATGRGPRRGQNPLLAALHQITGRDFTVPARYLTASRSDRAAFLAGWIDTDGNVMQGGYEVTQKRLDYAEAICFLARSLGLRATMTEKRVDGRLYWRIGIRGRCWEIPVRIARKKLPGRELSFDPTRTNFRLEQIGDGEWAGFMVDGDGRFLLGDFTVTHNSHVLAWVVPLHRIVFNPNIRILLLCETDKIAIKRLRRIRLQLERNKLLIDDFATDGSFRDPSAPWTDGAFQVRRSDESLNEATVEAAGAGGAITGGHFDLIIADDPESLKSVHTAHVRGQTREWWGGTVIPLLVPWGELIVIGTRKHNDDLYARLKADPTFKTIEDKAIAGGVPDAAQVEYLRDADGAVVSARVTGWAGSVLWPERYSIGRLMVLRFSIGSVIFGREYQNEVTSDDNAVFRLEWLKAAAGGGDVGGRTIAGRGTGLRAWRSSAEVQPGWAVVLTDDPAFVDDERKAQDTDSDYFVMWAIAINLTTWRRRLINGWRLRGLTADQFGARLRAMAALYTPPVEGVHPAGALRYIAVENNHLGKLYELGIRKTTDLPLVPHSTTSKKADPYEGVPAMSSLFENGQIDIALDGADPEYLAAVEALLDELHGLGKEPHDDTVMALWIGECVIRRMKDFEERTARARTQGRPDPKRPSAPSSWRNPKAAKND
jgi:hypothetical protein